MKTKNKPLTVLSIDGGGVRGIIPARILQALEEKTKQPTGKLFDVISGTSTGGLIATGLTASHDAISPIHSAKNLVDFYKKKSSCIFNRSVFRAIYTGNGLWKAKYDRAYLDEILTDLFGDAVLSKTLSNVVVASYGLHRQLPHLWSGRLARKYPQKDFYVRDAAGATSAAPTFFAPKEIFNTSGQQIYCEVDGGLYANNPASIAGIEAMKLSSNMDRKNVIFVSLGTGINDNKENLQNKNNTGKLGWLKKDIIGLMINANVDMVDREIYDVFPHYYRLQISLPKKLLDMDNGDPENLNQLLKFTDEYLADEEELDKLVKVLQERKLKDASSSFTKEVPVYR